MLTCAISLASVVRRKFDPSRLVAIDEVCSSLLPTVTQLPAP